MVNKSAFKKTTYTATDFANAVNSYNQRTAQKVAREERQKRREEAIAQVENDFKYATTPTIQMPKAPDKNSISSITTPRPLVPTVTYPEVIPQSINNLLSQSTDAKVVSDELYDVIVKERERKDTEAELKGNILDAEEKVKNAKDFNLVERVLQLGNKTKSDKDVAEDQYKAAVEKYFQNKYGVDDSLDVIYRSLAEFEHTEEVEKDLDDMRKALFGGDKVEEFLKSNIWGGIVENANGMYAMADATVGQALKSIGWENNPVSFARDVVQKEYEELTALSDSLAVDTFDKDNTIGKGIRGAVAFLPDVAAMWLTKGKYKPASPLFNTFNLGPIASTATKSQKLAATVNAALTTVSKNPMYWTSFARTYGLDYERAFEKIAAQNLAKQQEAGVEPSEFDKKVDNAEAAFIAGLYATLTSSINALVEMGGAQALPAKLQGKSSRYLFSLVESAIGEGLEENIQGIISEVNEKLLYYQEKELGEIFDLNRIAEEFKVGSLVGLLLGGGQTIYSASGNVKYAKLGKTVKKTMNAEDLITYARKSSNEIIRNVAKESTGKNISNQNLGMLYAYAAKDVTTAFKSVNDVEGTANVFKEFMSADVPQAIKTMAFSQAAEKFEALSAETNVLEELLNVDNTTTKTESKNAGLTDLSAANKKLDPVQKSVNEATGVKDLTKQQQLLKKVANHYGVKIDFKNLDETRTDKNGKQYVFSPEGYYDPTTNTIVLNTNDYYKNHRPLLFILKHEMTHSMEKAGKDFEKFVAEVETSEAFENYAKTRINSKTGKAYTSLDEWYEDIVNRYKKAGEPLGNETRSERTGAKYEAVADFVADVLFLGETKTAEQFLGSLSVESRNRFIAWIQDVLAKLKTVFIGDSRYTEIERLEKQFLEVANKVAKMNKAEPQTESASKKTSKNTSYSFSSIANTFFGNENLTVEEFESGEYKNTEGYKNYVDTCLNNLKQTNKEYNEETARKSVEKQIDGIVEVAIAAKKAGYDILDSAEQRSKKDSKKRLLFSSLEPNSDYFTSSDISAECDKRKNFAEIYDSIVKKEEKMGVPKDKRFFSNIDNYFYIHQVLADKGLTQPCRQCYVESMRKNLAPMAENFLKLVNETNPSNKNNDQLFNEKGETKSNNAKLRNKVIKVFAENNYDIKLSDLNIEMLTTADGLARLKLQAPLIYEAFNSFYGQSKPKMPRKATPFRFGELTALLTDSKGKIKTKLVEKINSTGGFRLQSYSDFQIENFTDVLQVIFEAGTLGLNGHAYTKVPAFLDATEGTNLKRNVSIFMYKDGDAWKIDKNDSYPGELEEIYKTVQSDKTGNTGIIAVSQNKEMSAWVIANDHIGYMIPFHKSGLKMDTVRDTDVKTDDGRVVKGYSNAIDHTKQQTEVYADDSNGHKALTKVKRGINIYDKKVGWDFENKDNLPQKELIEKNLKSYIDACENAGYIPKFRDYVMNNQEFLNTVLNYAKEQGFADKTATIQDIAFEYKGYTIPYGYYKLLGDFSMFSPDGKASPQKTLSLENYDFKKAVDFFKDAKKLKRNELLQQFANDGERAKYKNMNLSNGELEKIIKNKRAEVVDTVLEKDPIIRTDPDGINTNKKIKKSEVINDKYGLQYSLPDNPTPLEIGDAYKNGEITAEEYEKLINQSWSKQIKQEGAIDQGEMVAPPNKPNPTPVSVKSGTKVSEHIRTILESGYASKEMETYLKEKILDGLGSFTPTSNEKDINKAARKIQKQGYQNALNTWRTGLDGLMVGSHTVAQGEALLRLAMEQNNAVDIVNISADLAELSTRTAQSLQAFSLLKRMGGIGQLVYIQRSVNKLNQDLQKRSHNKADIVKVDKKLAERLAKAETEGEYEVIYNKIMQDIADQVPATFLDKWNAWRYMAMLFNPTTHVRNMSGNAIFVPAVRMKDLLALAGEKAFVKQENRTKSLKVKKEYQDFASKDFEQVKSLLTGTGKYNPTDDIKEHQKIFKNKVLEGLRRLNFNLLEAEDALFLKRHYRHALGGFLQARKLDLNNLTSKQLAEARNYAFSEALKATYRDASMAANIISQLSKLPVGNVLVEGVLPFKKTPINVLKRGMEYSPVGLVKTLSLGLWQLKTGKITATQFIDGLAAGVTGTGLTVLGALLASLGIIKGGFDDEETLDRLMGKQEYSVQIGDKSYTIDWAAPASIPFFMGVAAQEYKPEEDGDFLTNLYNFGIQGFEPILNLSMLSGINDVINSVSYAESNENLPQLVGAAIGSYFSQLLPTIFGKTANVIDDTRRMKYIDKTSNIPELVQSALNKIYAKTPWLSKNRAEYIDAWGETKYTGNFFERFFQQFVSPGYASTVDEKAISEEALRLYRETGDKSVIPSTPAKYFEFNKTRRDLSKEEYFDYATLRGQMQADIVSEAINSEAYKKLNDEQKALIFSTIYSFANAYAKTTLKYSYEEVATMVGKDKNEEYILTKEKWDKLDDKAKRLLVNDKFFNKKVYEKAYKAYQKGESVSEVIIKQVLKDTK